MDSPIFIVGMQRSGTTLMATMLSRHPEINIGYETTFLSRFLPAWKKAVTRVEKEKVRLDYFNSPDFRALGLPDFSSDGLDDPQSLFHAILCAMQKKAGKPRIGEKTPDHCMHLDTLFSWYPNARVIWMMRDPRAVVASWRKTGWDRQSHQALARRWAYLNRTLLHRYGAAPQLFVMPYESLVCYPDSMMRQVCNFVGVAWQSSYLTDAFVPSTTAHGADVWTREHLERAFKLPDRESLHKWESDLTPIQAAMIARICDMGEYGGDRGDSVYKRYPIRSRILEVGQRIKDKFFSS